MACQQRIKKMQSDLDRVILLAQKQANISGVKQIIYKTVCDGTTIYRFSDNWKGKEVKTVLPDKKLTGKSIPRNTKNKRSKSIESKK